jgi:hypothetical protein
MFNKLAEYANKREMRESRDEIVMGEIIAAMGRKGFPTISFDTGTTIDTGYQAVVFATPADPMLHTLTIVLDRKTGGGAMSEKVVGSKATLRVIGEVKNYLADPDDLLAMWRTDAANIFRMPMLGQVKLDHQLNSVLATKQIMIELSEFDGPEDRPKIEAAIDALHTELRNALAPFKRQSIIAELF